MENVTKKVGKFPKYKGMHTFKVKGKSLYILTCYKLFHGTTILLPDLQTSDDTNTDTIKFLSKLGCCVFSVKGSFLPLEAENAKKNPDFFTTSK